MKRTIYILLLAVFGILSATAENNFIEKFANQKGVTYVNISKALLNMMPEGQIDAEGLNLKAVINELDRIQILSKSSLSIRENRKIYFIWLVYYIKKYASRVIYGIIQM